MKNFSLLLFLLALFTTAALASPTTPNSFHFQPVPGATLLCQGATSANYTQFPSGAAANAPDVLIKNLGSVIAYYEIGVGGSSATVATIPTGSVGGSQAINPGEADLISKFQADTISCITASGTANLSVTPGTGN